ncbi:MAG: 2'-5' RNA ligase family protein [Parasphingorhabdus sp.]
MTRLLKPIIMTATMGDSEFAWANGLRKLHYPPERNYLSAHITLFHHLPPQGLEEIIRLIKQITQNHSRPVCALADVMHLGRGVAYRLQSPDLLDIRQFLAESFHGILSIQDQQTPRLHVTVQNKVTIEESKELFRKLKSGFSPRPFEINGLALHYYLDGPWKKIGSWRFRGHH